MSRTNIIETIKKINQEVLLKGWVHFYRDKGKIIFIELRDVTGIVQCVVWHEDKDVFEVAKTLKAEDVVEILGQVNQRPENQVNKEIETGGVEVSIKKIKVINKTQADLPFEISKDKFKEGTKEELRLKYRYLDLRRLKMKDNIKNRHKVIHFFRNYLTAKGFIEIQTPILSKSTPEGARDYVVPSRLHKGKFFALPQAPQQYKQLLMVAGFERYFQVAPCFRDEDARADRSPGEFYQLDIETSFMSQEEILNLIEKMFIEMVKTLFPKKIITQKPWPRMNYTKVMEKYGTDKPDLRKDKNNPEELAFAWIVNFPLLVKQTAEDKFIGAGEKWAPSHNMFTQPKEEDIKLLETDPGKVKSYQHDLVCNGFEVGGGAIRIYDIKIQEKVWNLIGFTDKQKKEFKHYYEAFKYGVPPHGGIAPGIDRLMMILMNEKNLREVTAFPLTSDGRDLMMNAPSEINKEQLDELGLKLK